MEFIKSNKKFFRYKQLNNDFDDEFRWEAIKCLFCMPVSEICTHSGKWDTCYSTVIKLEPVIMISLIEPCQVHFIDIYCAQFSGLIIAC